MALVILIAILASSAALYGVARPLGADRRASPI